MSAPLAAGWTKGVDVLSGEVYYTNDATGESTWTKPLIVVEFVEVTAQAGSLPVAEVARARDCLGTDFAADCITAHNTALAELAAAGAKTQSALMERLAARERKQAQKKREAQKSDPGDGLGPLPVHWKLISMPGGTQNLYQMPDGSTTFDDPRTEEIECSIVKTSAAVAQVADKMGVDGDDAEAALEAHGWDAPAACFAIAQRQAAATLAAMEATHRKELDATLQRAATETQRASASSAAAPAAESPFIVLRTQCPPGISGGMSFPVDLPDGRRVMVGVPAGTPSGGAVQFQVARSAPTSNETRGSDVSHRGVLGKRGKTLFGHALSCGQPGEADRTQQFFAEQKRGQERAKAVALAARDAKLAAMSAEDRQAFLYEEQEALEHERRRKLCYAGLKGYKSVGLKGRIGRHRGRKHKPK